MKGNQRGINNFSVMNIHINPGLVTMNIFRTMFVMFPVITVFDTTTCAYDNNNSCQESEDFV